MKFALMNGWKDAPHCRLRFILFPFGWNRTRAFTSVSVFGFVIFFIKD